MEYTDHDLLDYWHDNYGYIKTRKTTYLDPRNYIMAILHYKFGYIEEELAELFQVDHSSINHAKKMAYNHIVDVPDSGFIKHVKELMNLFPYDFPFPGDLKEGVLYSVTIYLNKETMKSLDKYSKATLKRKNRVCSEIITSKMKEWDV